MNYGGFQMWSPVRKTTPVSCCFKQKRGGFSYHTILNPETFVTPEYKIGAQTDQIRMFDNS